MDEASTTFVGLDTHSGSTSVGVADPGRDPPRFLGTVGPSCNELQKALRKVGPPSKVSIYYEAGPCGYTLARHLIKAGYRCHVVAPSRIPRRPGDRVKTDRRDSLTLASLARAGELMPIYVPDERDEAIRDLCRARIDAVRARLKARQQLKALLLRHGKSYTGKTSWTAAHERYLATVSFAHRAQQIAFEEYRQAVSEANDRVQRLTASLSQELQSWRLRPLVEALMCLRGIDETAGITVAAEMGDLRRFARPREIMGFLGVVPSEHTSGERSRRGRITKTGNSHARRVLVEAAWNYRFPPRISARLQKRQGQQPAAVRKIAWDAQLRLSHRYKHLKARGMNHNKICVAIARELSGFIWNIGQHVNVE